MTKTTTTANHIDDVLLEYHLLHLQQDLKVEGSKSNADGAVSAYVQTKFVHNSEYHLPPIHTKYTVMPPFP